MMNWSRIEPWDYVVVSVAAEYHKKYSMVELDDIKQSLYEWFVSHPRKLTEWEAVGPKDAKNLLYRSLRNQALDYCQLWKAKSLGYEPSDLFYYEPEMVEALLPAIIRGDMSVAPVLSLGMPGRPPAPAEGGNLMAMMVEIKAAYEKLNTEDRSILYLKYAESLDYSSIATTLEISSDDAARMRHNRAIKKLITRLGGFRSFLDQDNEEIVNSEVGSEVDTYEASHEQGED
jgi:DNA-directed RNA polymerase specialized sigma24 family protein